MVSINPSLIMFSLHYISDNSNDMTLVMKVNSQLFLTFPPILQYVPAFSTFSLIGIFCLLFILWDFFLWDSVTDSVDCSPARPLNQPCPITKTLQCIITALFMSLLSATHRYTIVWTPCQQSSGHEFYFFSRFPCSHYLVWWVRVKVSIWGRISKLLGSNYNPNPKFNLIITITLNMP